MAELRETRQKNLIENEIKKIKSFFTAEELYEKIKKKDSMIGIATVYRFLKNLAQKRKIHFYMCNRKALYSISKMNHCHFICEICGKNKHIDVNSLDFMKNKILGDICHFQIDVTGICNNCKSKKKGI